MPNDHAGNNLDPTTFRMPAEWEPHEAVWLQWPHEGGVRLKRTGPGKPAIRDTSYRRKFAPLGRGS
ncbi:MAG: hypothetical protein HOL02_21225 [Rhodospirillaceae bacterium]|nr:hypothetical protein [Rhodospirillaceae bacterium]MBT6512959.1 hypothetical protein [Rhodospirillaceae bacterium]MBT7595641.1 hypothetical protein [Gemmatimonadota bacterium]MBT7647637.1 hypothetical protein [Rhodospirillaceae bacterium]